LSIKLARKVGEKNNKKVVKTYSLGTKIMIKYKVSMRTCSKFSIKKSSSDSGYRRKIFSIVKFLIPRD